MRYFVTLTTVLLWLACSRVSKDQIIGRWEFEKFEVSDNKFELADSLKEMRKEMERLNQGVIFSFQKDGRLTTLRRTGESEKVVSTVTYKFQKRDVILVKDTVDETEAILTIHFLSNTKVKLSMDDNLYDVMVFRKMER